MLRWRAWRGNSVNDALEPGIRIEQAHPGSSVTWWSTLKISQLVDVPEGRRDVVASSQPVRARRQM
jgi:hypothetical protein